MKLNFTDPKSKIHQRIGNVSEGLVWNYLVVYLKTILDKENGKLVVGVPQDNPGQSER